MNIFKGNLTTVLVSGDTKGWFIGDFFKDDSFFKTSNLEVKWAVHKKGEIKKCVVSDKYSPTLVILVKGKFKYEYNKNSKVDDILKKVGDYLLYDASKAGHVNTAMEDSTLIVIRWFPIVENKQYPFYRLGNVDDLYTKKNRGWFIGRFIEDNEFFKSDEVEVKWSSHKAGEIRKSIKNNRDAKTITILIAGKCKLSADVDKFYEEKILTIVGDYFAYSTGDVNHTFEAIEPTVMLTIRWPSV